MGHWRISSESIVTAFAIVGSTALNVAAGCCCTCPHGYTRICHADRNRFFVPAKRSLSAAAEMDMSTDVAPP